MKQIQTKIIQRENELKTKELISRLVWQIRIHALCTYKHCDATHLLGGGKIKCQYVQIIIANVSLSFSLFLCLPVSLLLGAQTTPNPFNRSVWIMDWLHVLLIKIEILQPH